MLLSSVVLVCWRTIHSIISERSKTKSSHKYKSTNNYNTNCGRGSETERRGWRREKESLYSLWGWNVCRLCVVRDWSYSVISFSNKFTSRWMREDSGISGVNRSGCWLTCEDNLSTDKDGICDYWIAFSNRLVDWERRSGNWFSRIEWENVHVRPEPTAVEVFGGAQAGYTLIISFLHCRSLPSCRAFSSHAYFIFSALQRLSVSSTCRHFVIPGGCLLRCDPFFPSLIINDGRARRASWFGVERYSLTFPTISSSYRPRRRLLFHL